MTEYTQKIRTLVDLQGCQTQGSHMRGVGRYSRELFNAMVRVFGADELYGLMSSTLPFETGINNFPSSRMLQLPPLPEWHTPRNHQGGQKERLDAVAYSSVANQIKPDVIHVSSMAEGFIDRVPLPTRECKAPGQILSATLYDLIPLLFPNEYLGNSNTRQLYMSRLSWLKQTDLLLAISEASRQDAIDYLNISPERIVTIWGGISSHFTPAENREKIRSELARRYGLRPRTVLYTGGDDFRKNIRGALSGFAAIPAALRQNCQLIVVCAMDAPSQLRHKGLARKAGLLEEEVLFTGYIPEEDLIDFYRICDAFMFPSLYEGLGLPVLEAMACGAPVIGANNSSIKEIIQRPDALFNPNSDMSIAKTLTHVLTNADFANKLRNHGLARAQDFSWDKTANLALEAFTEASERGKERAIQVAFDGWLPRKRIAIMTPLPPCRSGIADYNAQFLPFLARHFDIDLFVDGYTVEDDTLSSTFRIFDARDFEHVAHNYETILYEFGNSEFHAYMLPLLEKYPGIVGLHDAFLSGLFYYVDYLLGKTGRYTQEMLKTHGPQARQFFAPIMNHPDPLGSTIREFPCTKGILDKAIGIISHASFNEELTHYFYPEGYQAPYRIIPQAIAGQKLLTQSERTEKRKMLGFEEDSFVIATFGHIAWTKGGDLLLNAFRQLRKGENSPLYLIYVGELPQDTFGYTLKKAISNAKLGNHVQITGFLSEAEYKKYLQVVDVGVQLRTYSRGGTPRGVLDCLAYSVPVVVNNDYSYTDYPDDVVIKLLPEPTLTELTETLRTLWNDPKKRARFSSRGHEYIQTIHDPKRCAAAYAAAIHDFTERQRLSTPASIATAFVPYLAATENPKTDSDSAVDWIASLKRPDFSKRHIFVDVTCTQEQNQDNPRQYIIKKLTKALYLSNHTGFLPVAIEWHDNHFGAATQWLQTQGLHCLHEPEPSSEPIIFKPEDILLIFDPPENLYSKIASELQRAKGSKARVIIRGHDFSNAHSLQDFVDGKGKEFAPWLQKVIALNTGLTSPYPSQVQELPSFTWEESANALLDVILKDNWMEG